MRWEQKPAASGSDAKGLISTLFDATMKVRKGTEGRSAIDRVTRLRRRQVAVSNADVMDDESGERGEMGERR